jgi:outer membrane receptor protein involved in Fe transport
MKRTIFVVAAFAAVLLAVGTYAQTTGSIDGAIVDENMAFLPGVTIEATSPSLQGTKVAVSDRGGKFHFVFMPPGVYTVKFTLQGFATVEQTGLTVELGRVVALNVQMHSAFKEEVVVSGTTPVINVRSPEMGSNLTSQAFTSLPIARNYASIVQTTPGTSTDAVGTMVYGSTGSENAYYIDGVNTTGVHYAEQMKELQFEFIQEMQVKTGAYAAEFGRATGGMINVITKSGGNEFHGDGFAYYDNNSLQSSLKPEVLKFRNENAGSYVVNSFKRQDYGVDLGGYLLKDKIWFFGAYDKVKQITDRETVKDFTPYGGPAIGAIYPVDRNRDLWSAKLTWRMTPNHSLIASGFGDPTVDSGPIRGLAGPESTFMGENILGGTDKTAKYEGVLGTNWVVNAQASQHLERDLESGPGVSIKRIRDNRSELYAQTGTELMSGGLDYVTQNRFRRDDYRGDVSYFLNNFGGDHEFKVGAEYEKVLPTNSAYHSGGDRIWWRCLRGHLLSTGCEPGFDYYQHEVFLTERPPGGATDPNIGNYLREPFVANGRSDNTALYLQDSWRPGSNLSLNLGIRWERQKLFDRFGTVVADIKDEWAPRLGVVWDPSGKGTSKVFANWGSFYETMPTDIIYRAFGGEITTLMANKDLNSIACDPVWNAKILAATGRGGCRTVGGSTEPVDPNLKGQYISEYVLGAEHEVVKDWIFGAKYIHRSLERVVEDSLSADTNYYIGNPGEGLLQSSLDQSYTYTYTQPKPKRVFNGVEISVRKRYTNNWQMVASYLYSKLEGNYDGTFQASTGQLDPNINSAFDYAEFQIHNSGLLTNDRPHQFRVSGSYTFNFGLDVGLSAYWRSGVPITAMGYNELYRNYELYLSNRGEFGRTNNEYEADLHLGYPLKLGGVELNFLVDVFNLLNRQGETNRNMNFDTYEAISVINYDTGAVEPPVTKGQKCSDLVSSGCNPGFNTTNTWQSPRQIRLGVRLTF